MWRGMMGGAEGEVEEAEEGVVKEMEEEEGTETQSQDSRTVRP